MDAGKLHAARLPGDQAEKLHHYFGEDLQQMLLELGFTWISSKYPAHESGEPMQEPSEAVYADIVRAQAEDVVIARPRLRQQRMMLGQ